MYIHVYSHHIQESWAPAAPTAPMAPGAPEAGDNVYASCVWATKPTNHVLHSNLESDLGWAAKSSAAQVLGSCVPLPPRPHSTLAHKAPTFRANYPSTHQTHTQTPKHPTPAFFQTRTHGAETLDTHGVHAVTVKHETHGW